MTTSTGNPPAVKPEIIQWLDEQLTSTELAPQKPWIVEYYSLVQRLLTIKKESRPSAEQARNDLRKIRDMAQHERPLWKPIPHNHYLKHPEEHPSSGIRRPPTTDLSVPQALRREPINRVDSTGTPPNQSLSRIQTWLRLSVDVEYMRLEIPTSALRSSLSPDGETAAFVGTDSVSLYDLSTIGRRREMWNPDIDEVDRTPSSSLERGFSKIACPSGRNWTSVLLAGPYITLLSASPRVRDIDVSSLHKFSGPFQTMS